MTRRWILGLLAAASITTFAPAVKAAGPDIAYLTFARTVAIPGATLAPGTYIFEKVETGARSDIVRVMSRDRQHVFLTQFTEAEERPAGAAEKTGVDLAESDHGAAPKIETWYPAGDQFSYHFIYKQQ